MSGMKVGGVISIRKSVLISICKAVFWPVCGLSVEETAVDENHPIEKQAFCRR
jgi:hypothetical protein